MASSIPSPKNDAAIAAGLDALAEITTEAKRVLAQDTEQRERVLNLLKQRLVNQTTYNSQLEKELHKLQSKLDTEKGDLERLREIVGKVEPQQSHLAKQVNKIGRHAVGRIAYSEMRSSEQ